MDILQKNPNPTKDQHFMVDKDMLQLIYDSAEIQEGESIVEIGGGEGALTDYLANGKNFVTVIEKDPYYANFLKQKYENYPNVEVVFGDALDFDFSSYDRIVANLPYTITEPFLANLASSGALNYAPNDPKGSLVKKITLVISQNSLRKMVAPIQVSEGGHKHANLEFGLMGTICKAFSDIEVVTAVPSSAFFPEPAVTSFVVNLTPKKEKTTVDRIVGELLTDKKGNDTSIERKYQLLLAQGKIYKTGKYKDISAKQISSKFTSSNILDRNIYDLSNSQYSQLFQDLVRNDMTIKSSRKSASRQSFREKNYEDYLSNGSFDIASYEEDMYGIDEEEAAEEMFMKMNKKYQHKYDYLYDATRYDILLRRGLEFIDPQELYAALNPQTSEDIVRE